MIHETQHHEPLFSRHDFGATDTQMRMEATPPRKKSQNLPAHE
jgi:hypothetical protein